MRKQVGSIVKSVISKSVKVSIKNLNVSFRNGSKNRRKGAQFLDIFQNFSLDIRPGEYVVILGPSGCGKSTLLRLLTGTLQRFIPTAEVSGTIEISNSQGLENPIGLAPQSYPLVPWQNVIGNVLFPKILSGEKVDKCDRKTATAILEKLGIGSFSKAYPHELSGGIAQRVSLARAMCMAPDLLLLDEPLNAIDVFERERIQMDLRTWTVDRGITTVHVTHDIYEAAFIATRIVLLTGQANRIISEVNVPMDVRDSSFRESPVYNKLVTKLRGTLCSKTSDKGHAL